MNGTAVCTGMGHAVQVCLKTMIPALYAMMICSALFLSSGMDRILSAPLHPLSRVLFGCSGQILLIFLFSQVAGYPIGAKMLGTLQENGQLSKKQASCLAGVCFGGGPAFLSALFCEDVHHRRMVFLAGLLSNLILFCIMSRFLHADAPPVCPYALPQKGAAALVEAASTSGCGLLRICAMVILFGGLLSLLDAVGIMGLAARFLSLLIHSTPERAAQIICSFAEVSRITALFPYSTAELPVLGAILSFGGICVMLQIAAVTGGKLHMGCIFLMRCAAAALTGGWIALWQFLVPEKSVTAAVVIWSAPDVIQTGSPLPALFLLIMTVMLLWSVRKD